MTTITVCTTCRNTDSRSSGAPKSDEPRDGEQFLETIRQISDGINVRGVSCLMGCDHGCNIAISDTAKMTYVLGRFDGSLPDAEAIVEYAAKHRQSATGTVPYREWPSGVKGHFVARVPPLE